MEEINEIKQKDLDEGGKFVGDIDGLEIKDYNTQEEFFNALESDFWIFISFFDLIKSLFL